MDGKKKKAEEMKKYRNKLKANEIKWKEYLKKDAERKKEYRRKQKEKLLDHSRELSLKRKQERERKSKQRQLRKENEGSRTEIQLGGAYKCKQTLGKALRKVENALPRDEKRRNFIVLKLAEKYFKRDIIFKNTINVRKETETEEQISKVLQDFFARDDISRQSPEKKATLYVKNNDGKRCLYAKRHMLMSMKEAYNIFMNDHHDVKVSRTKFYDSRPKHVLLSSKTPHNVCVCKYHANFDFIISAAATILKNFPKNIKDFLLEVCCNVNNEKCMSNKCHICEMNMTDAFLPLVCKLHTSVNWKCWKDINNKVTLTVQEGSLVDLLNTIQDKLPSFKFHYFVKKSQETYFKFKKENICDGEVILQIDFAENYAITYQDEVQAAHYRRSLVTLFSCVAWLKNSITSFCILSDDLSHTKYSTLVFLDKIIKFLQAKTNICQISLFSDGCAGQFKNKYMISNICNMLEDFNLTHVEWSFFATSHGKGAVDGIGATVKRKIWEKVKTHKVILTTPEDVYNCASEDINNINFFYFSKTEIDLASERLKNRFNNVKSIPHLHKNHYFESHDKKKLLYGNTAKSDLMIYKM